MALAISLLGKPTVVRDGRPVLPPKGRKAWALLAYLVTSDRPTSREELARLLFGEADDPLGALRWNLAQLRRLLGQAEGLHGGQVELRLPVGTFVDLKAVVKGTWLEGASVPGIGRDLLEGMDFPSCPAFEVWLLSERRHIKAAAEAILREAALARLGSGDPSGAADLASRLVQLNPLEEGFQALLIRALAMTGDEHAARQQFKACVALFRKELGVEPGPDVRAAAQAGTASAAQMPTMSTGAAANSSRAHLEAGEAAILAGDIEPGLRQLRQAVTDAHRCGGVETQVEALVALGSSLISAVRSRDEEGAAALHEAISLAVASGQRSLIGAAYRELGFVDFLRARYDRAQYLLEKAIAVSGDQQAGLATALILLGACFSDKADYPAALEQLTSAVELAETLDDFRPLTRGLAFTARAHLLRGDLAEAREAAARSLGIARTSWTAYLPWPATLLAEVDLEEGDVDRAAEGFRQAFGLGCRLGDPCWEAMAARGIGRVEAARGNTDSAVEWLQDAAARAVRLQDAYLWAQGYALDALCSVAVEQGAMKASRWATDLESLAARTGMRELLARAYLHQCRLGDDAAQVPATVLIEQIDNPALQDLLGRISHDRSHGSSSI
jgi:DNA-binding SARP family transcriptional activator